MRSSIIIAGLLLAAAAPAVAGAQQVFDPAGAVSETALKATSGKADLGQLAIANQTNTVAGNSVNGTSTTGAVGFAGNAFQNLNGIAVINANSGNNVAINAALNVNVSISPK